jgi:hypothetical protein
MSAVWLILHDKWHSFSPDEPAGVVLAAYPTEEKANRAMAVLAAAVTHGKLSLVRMEIEE